MLSFHMLGLFPDLFDQYYSESLIGKARQKGLIDFHYHQLRDWAQNKYNTVDDKPYGGGAGMVFLPEVVTAAVRDLRSKHQVEHVVLTSPAGKPLTPEKAFELSKKKSILFICGRYEGVDQRAIDLVVDEELSIGDYVVTGGEVAACVMVDAVSRYIPGVVGKEDSVRFDSHSNGLLEHPHYTRPEVFENMSVPEVLLSGHHKNIEEWRHKESLERTWNRRPDLIQRAELSKDDKEFLKELIHKKG